MTSDLERPATLRDRGRRRFMTSLAAAGMTAAARPAFADPALSAVDFDHVTVVCSDLKRSIDFYRRILRVGVETAADGRSANLWLGAGAQRMSLVQATDPLKVGLYSFCLRVRELNRPSAAKLIEAAGGRAVRQGDRAGRALFTFTDRDGVRGQLVEAAAVRPAPATVSVGEGAAAIEPLKINHVTLNVADAVKAADFYKQCFGMWVQSAQGESTAVLGLGAKTGPEFPAVAVSRYGQPQINHVCFGMRAFDVARVMTVLHQAGVTSVEKVFPTEALTATIRWRHGETNGGGPDAPLGTPELYFTDPDRVVLQLQDISYCGGSGPLGSVCKF